MSTNQDMTAEQALDAVRNVLQRAYNSAEPVCCGRAGTECCGSPEPEWSEYDQQIMNDLQPVEEYLRQALTAPRVPEGFVRAGDYMDAVDRMEMIRGASQHCDCHAFEIANDYLHETHGGQIPLTAASAPADELAAIRERIPEWLCEDCNTVHTPPSGFDLTCKTPGCVGLLKPSTLAERKLREQVKVLEEALADAASYTRHSDYDWDMGFIKHVDRLLAARLRGGSDEN